MRDIRDASFYENYVSQGVLQTVLLHRSSHSPPCGACAFQGGSPQPAPPPRFRAQREDGAPRQGGPPGSKPATAAPGGAGAPGAPPAGAPPAPPATA